MADARRALSLLAALALVFWVCACGGGGGAGSAAIPPPSASGPTWTANVYQAASLFKDRCEVVRTGVDIEGNPFPDRAGSLLHENFWLRSWTHETYLWNTEVLDRNPASYDDRLEYFAVLRTTAVTPSGRDRDQFHFSEPTADFLAARNSEPAPTYGAHYIALSASVPRDFRVIYTEPDSPAAQNGLTRGVKILNIDGVDLVNAATQAEIDILNAGLFPDTAGESHTFVVQSPDASPPATIVVAAANVAPKPVNRLRTIDAAGANVGYVFITTFSPFAAEQEIADAISAFKAQGVSDLVLDLRYNGGGLLAVASQLSYMVAGAARTSGRTFERLEFNAASGSINPVTGEANTPMPFFNTGLGFSLTSGTPLDSLDLPRVFILSTDRTCSASESVINSLRGVGVEAVLIGAGTCGKPYGFYPQDNCGETYFTIQFRGVNDVGFGDYADGFVPANSNASFGVRTQGCAVADDYGHEQGETDEAMLAAALQYRATGACPPFIVPQAAPRLAEEAAPAPVRATRWTPMQEFVRNSRDLTMPD